MNKNADLDDSLAAGLEEAADGPEVGWQVLMANRLYHLAAHHLHMWFTLGPSDFRDVQGCTSPAQSPLYLGKMSSTAETFQMQILVMSRSYQRWAHQHIKHTLSN